MARTTVEDDLFGAFDVATDSVEEGEEVDAFKMAKGMSIPVPKSLGKMWSAKITEAKKVYETEHSLWDTVMKMYRETGTTSDESHNSDFAYAYRMKRSTDENIIRTNIRTIMRSTYMRNPHMEFTSTGTANDDQTDVIQQAIEFLMSKKTAPGLNMKPKARRWILHGQLTNHGVIRLDYQEATGSVEEARSALEKLESDFSNAKTGTEVKEIVQRIKLVYENMPLLATKGIGIVNVQPNKFIVDPDCTTLDLTDAWWTAEFFDMNTKYMHEKYYDKDEEGNWIRLADGKTVDNPKEVEGDDVADSVTEIVLGNESDQRREYRKKDTTECCYVYDKAVRRIYLFNTDDWTYPLWVYEDTVKLSRFFRHFLLGFTETVDSIVQPGEASFYVGQVEEINIINRKAKEIRDSAFGAIIYDKEMMDAEDMKKLIKHLRNPKEVEAFGIKKGTEKKLSDAIDVFVPPAFDYQALFNQSSMRSAIDRASSISDAEKGEQFKTNTTNQAIDYYENSQQRSNSMLIECIEDALDSLGWAIAEILVSKYTKEDIQLMLGPDYAQKFTPMTVDEFNQTYRMQIAAGSIEKPNTEFKKREAIQIAQSIGQFASAVPGTAMRLIMRMFEAAFSSFLVKKEDWDSMNQEAAANLNKGISTNGQTAPNTNPGQQ